MRDEQAIIAATPKLAPAALVAAAAGRPVRRPLRHGGADLAPLGLKPWKAETFMFSTDPERGARIHDVVGLYLAPQAKAVVVCIHEKTQIQALALTAPILPDPTGDPGEAKPRRQAQRCRHAVRGPSPGLGPLGLRRDPGVRFEALVGRR